jgi:hypothetical protein
VQNPAVDIWQVVSQGIGVSGMIAAAMAYMAMKKDGQRTAEREAEQRKATEKTFDEIDAKLCELEDIAGPLDQYVRGIEGRGGMREEMDRAWGKIKEIDKDGSAKGQHNMNNYEMRFAEINVRISDLKTTLENTLVRLAQK